jgi:hypothetical protein
MNAITRAFESNWAIFATRLVALAAFGAVALLGVQYTNLSHQNHKLATCVADWANSYTSSVTIRSDANNVRANALHKLLLDAIESSPGTTADLQAFLTAVVANDFNAEKAAATKYLVDATGVNAQLIQKDINDFVTTEESYQQALKTHPIPPPPKLVCK